MATYDWQERHIIGLDGREIALETKDLHVYYGSNESIKGIDMKFEKNKIFNASTCGDNCAKWLLKIAETEDRTINLRHLMKFEVEPFDIRILNTNEIVHTMEELVSIAGEFV